MRCAPCGEASLESQLTAQQAQGSAAPGSPWRLLPSYFFTASSPKLDRSDCTSTNSVYQARCAVTVSCLCAGRPGPCSLFFWHNAALHWVLGPTGLNKTSGTAKRSGPISICVPSGSCAARQQHNE